MKLTLRRSFGIALLSAALCLALGSVVIGSGAYAFTENYDWVLKELKVGDFRMGQHQDDVVLVTPDLDFSLESNKDENIPDVVATLWHPAQVERHQDGMDINTWGLYLYFARSNGRLFRVIADFPPLDVQADTQLIDSVLKRLGHPQSRRTVDDAIDQSLQIEELIWGREGMLFSQMNFSEKSAYLYMKFLSNTITGEMIILSLEYSEARHAS